MPHFTHKLKAYTAEVHKRLVFCENCGKDEEEGLSEPCTGKIYVRTVDKQEERK